MKQNKLIEILQKLETKELTEFKEYVHSPYFNKHQTVRALCDYLLKYAPDFNTQKIDKEIVYKNLFPEAVFETAFDETTIYTYSSNLLALLNDFLAVRAFEKNLVQQKLYTLQELSRRDLDKPFEGCVKQFELLQKKSKEQGRDYHFYQSWFYDELDKRYLKNPSADDLNIQLKDGAKDIVFLIDKLEMACDMLNRNRIIGSSYQPGGLDFMLNWIESDKDYFLSFSELKIQYNIYKLLQSDEEHYYQELKTDLASKIDDYNGSNNGSNNGFNNGSNNASKIKNFYDYLINYCTKKMNSGSLVFYREFFELHRFLLQKNVLLEQGKLSEWDYKNIATTGSYLEEFEWTEVFIKDYKDRVDASVRENVYAFNLAYFYYNKRDFDKALKLLTQVEFTNPSYYIGAKIIQLKTYYALEEMEAALSLIASFKTYLQRSKVLSDYKKQTNENMLKMAKKIIQLKQNEVAFSKKKLLAEKEKLVKEIERLSPIASADWLVEIIDS